MEENPTPKRAAAAWFILLREEPDDAALTARFQAWLAADPRHAEAWTSVTRAATAMNRMAETDPEKKSEKKKDHILPRHPARSASRSRAKRLRAAGMAMALAAAACAGLFLVEPDMLLRWQADHYAPPGETRTVQLADGTTIILAPLSALDVRTEGSGRAVKLLRGEALFKVRHDPAHPFVVQAGEVRATDIGTVFDVALSAQGTTVAVREGASRVNAPGALSSSQDLGPGAWVAIKGASVRKGVEQPEKVGMWSDGLLMVENTTVSTLIGRLRPWQRGIIVLLDADLGKQTVSGIYDLHRPTEALALAVRQHGGRVHQLSPWLTLVTR